MEECKIKVNEKLVVSVIAGLLCSFVISLLLFQVFAIILFVFWLFEPWVKKLKTFDNFVYIIFVFGIIRAASIFFSEFPAESYEAFARESLFYTTFISLNYYLKRIERKKFSLLYKIFINAGVVVSAIGIIQFAAGFVHRAQGLSFGYSTFSLYLLFVFVFLINSRQFNSEKEKYFWAIKTGIVLSGIITSLGRTNIVIAILAGIVSLIIRREKVKFVFVIITVVVLISLGSFSENRSEIQNRISQPAALSDRDIIWNGFKEIYDEHPFLGFGPRTFSKVFPFKEQFADKGINSWHNEFFQLYIESGIFAFLTVMFFYLLIFTEALKKFKLYEKGEPKDIIIAMLFLIPSLILASVTDFLWGSIIISALIAVSSNIYIGIKQSD